MSFYYSFLLESQVDTKVTTIKLKDGSTSQMVITSKSFENKNDKLSSTGVKLNFFIDTKKIGEASISGIDSDMPFIYDFEVNKKYRGKGYGNAILDYCIKNYKVNDLSVSPNNLSAISLYKKKGFKKRFMYDDNGEQLMYMQIHKRGYENK